MWDETISTAEYIWIDGTTPTKKLRSKTKVMSRISENLVCLESFDPWVFDGSSTNQASGNNSDLILVPVWFVDNPLRGKGHYLVLCEVFNSNEEPHETNTRAKLRETLNAGGAEMQSWWGFEQEYVLLKDGKILGWPPIGCPYPQGPYYCGVGADEVVGRDIVEDHMRACIWAGLMISGINAEVMLGQWEFQIGYRDHDYDFDADPLIVSDHLWLARWLLYRIGENYGVYATLDPKPKKGNWNGSGCHVNFSTKDTREVGGLSMFGSVLFALYKNHNHHMTVYGAGNERRMTGQHETSKYDEFTWGVKDDLLSMVGNRSASVRIPPPTVQNDWKGYLEDRRPAANVDPYEACNVILQTLLETKEVTKNE